jgi:hypothetical protein
MICLCLWCCFVPAAAQNTFSDSLHNRLLDSIMIEVGSLSLGQRDSLIFAIKETFTEDELLEANRLKDSLYGKGDRKHLIVPIDRIKNGLCLKPIREMPGASVYLSLPDDWKDIDPFAHQSMMPRLPKRYQAAIPEYARFTKGMDGYYFASEEMGIFGYGWTSFDSSEANQEIKIALQTERGKMSPTLFKALSRSKNALVILAVILQVLLL